jgi:hypothetical protein
MGRCCESVLKYGLSAQCTVHSLLPWRIKLSSLTVFAVHSGLGDRLSQIDSGCIIVACTHNRHRIERRYKPKLAEQVNAVYPFVLHGGEVFACLLRTVHILNLLAVRIFNTLRYIDIFILNSHDHTAEPWSNERQSLS